MTRRGVATKPLLIVMALAALAVVVGLGLKVRQEMHRAQRAGPAVAVAELAAVAVWEDRASLRRKSASEFLPRGVLELEEAVEGSINQVFTLRPQTTSGVSAIDFDQVIVSWNVAVEEKGSGAIFDLRVGPTEEDEWSPWLRVGVAGGSVDGAPAVREFNDGKGGGKIDVDVFRSARTYSYLQVRLTQAGWKEARLVRLVVTASDTGHRVATNPRMASGVFGDAVKIDVPFRTQKTDDPKLAGRLCSPTSLTMVLGKYGVERNVQEVAAAVWDRDFDLYGNWPRNVQAGYELGVQGFVTRFTDWSQVAKCLRGGVPIIASIRAPKGLIKGAPYTELDGGHLIVLTGLGGEGGVYVNDPASGMEEKGRCVYSIGDLTRAWMEMGNGVGYVMFAKRGE